MVPDTTNTNNNTTSTHYISRTNKHYNINGMSTSTSNNMYITSVMDIISRILDIYKLIYHVETVTMFTVIKHMKVLYYNTVCNTCYMYIH